MAQTTYNLSVNTGDGNANSGNMTSCFNTSVYNSDEDAQIMHWLSPLEPNNRHQDVRNDRFDGVGDWLLGTREFREWRECEGGADKAILFCSGGPGVGKTYLSSLVVDSLCDEGKKEDIAVACLYCDYISQQEQTITSMMGAILKQLLARGDIPKSLREAFQEGKKEVGGRGLRLPDLMRVLRMTIASLPQVFICIDALDEYLPKNPPELLESLRDIVRKSPKTRIFLTGRPHVKEDIQRYFPGAVVIPISPNTDDIRNYLEIRLSRDPEPDAMNDDLRADLIRVISEKIADIFLLVTLYTDAILGEVTIRQRRKKLEEMTKGKGLGDAYTATLARLKAQKGNKSILGMKVLMWVAYSERPLRAKELCHAMGVEVGSADLDIENVPTLRTLIASSLGLVTVEASSSTVRLVHLTLQEHLSGDPTLFASPHSTIAEVCLTYLNFSCVWDLSPTLRSAPETMPLLEYASCYWGEHTRRKMTGNVKKLALRILDRFDEHVFAQLMLLHYCHQWDFGPYLYWMDRPTGFTRLHGAAFLGIVGIVHDVLEMKEWDVNATDSTGSTALLWAATSGHDEAVKMLLERADVDPDQADTGYGRTPLSYAALSGSEGAVKMLLERVDVNPDQADSEYGRTPLSYAASSGSEAAVKMLLERVDVNPDRAESRYGRTPLSYAAWSGSEGAVRMLLERADVNPDQADTFYGRTPLSYAAMSGSEGAVKVLLERVGVNPDQADTEYGRTPLSYAADSGHEGAVKMLLERVDVNPDRADTKYGRTPLSHAAESGREGVVEILLERADVNPDRADTKYGRTPLSYAAESGSEGVVEILLERADVNPDWADTKYGRTPLSWAAWNGHVRVVKLLLERKHVHTTILDNDNQTPLWLALSRGHNEVASILLERENINSDTTAPAGQASPPPTARHEDESPAEIQFQAHNPNADTTHLPPAGPCEKDAIPTTIDSVPTPTDNSPPTEPSTPPQPPSISPPKPPHPPSKTNAHPNTRPTTSLSIARYILIASFVCLFAILIYILPSLSPDLFPFHKYLPSNSRL